MLIGFDASRAFVSERTGTENYSLNLLLALAKIDRKNRYRIYLRRVPNRKSVFAKLPSNFELKPIRPERFWTQIGLALESWLYPVDVLFVPAHTLPVLRNPKVKTVVTIHDLGVEYLPAYHQFPQRYYLDLASKYAAARSEAIIAVSEATKHDLVKRYGVNPKKVSVVHEAVDTRFFKPQSASSVDKVKKKYNISGKYVLFVGTVQPRKNLEVLIEAFSKISVPDLNLVIAGKLGWDFEKILEAPKKFGAGGRVRFLKYVRREDLPSLYTGATVFAFPSLFEGFGLPILEALACNCPVIASDIGPHREILAKISGKTKISPLEKIGEAMILVKQDDVDKWARVLYQTITYSNRRLKTDFRRKISVFNWEKTARETLRLFLNLQSRFRIRKAFTGKIK